MAPADVKEAKPVMAYEILREGMRCWNAMAGFRAERARNKKYAFGRQWDDSVVVDGVEMSEADYIRMQGSIPLKNNLIRRLVRSVLGVYRNNVSMPVCEALETEGGEVAATGNSLLRVSARMNSIEELYARTMEEFLISGLAVHRKWFGIRRGEDTALTDYVNPAKFFIDTRSSDFRGEDVEIIGEVHDMTFSALCSSFADNAEAYNRLSEIYRAASDPRMLFESPMTFGCDRSEISDFLTAPSGECRVIEVWRKEHLPRYRCHDPLDGALYKIEAADFERMVGRENERRHNEGYQERGLIRAEWMMDDVWRYYFIAPTGELLRSGDTPYRHGSHPYVFKAYPYIDGEIHSFVNDVIDQQRHTNRLITLYDWVMRASAKGVLLFPESSIPDGWDLQDVADEWSRFNGVIMLKAKEGVPMPQQVSGNTSNIGIAELLNIQLKMFEDISGVTGALKGELDTGSVSGTLYTQQTNNAMNSLSDLLATYREFMLECTRKEVSLLLQYRKPELQLPTPASWRIV